MESCLPASMGEDTPFLCDSTRSPTCLVPRTRTSLVVRDSAWSPANLLPRARTSHSCSTQLGVPPACFLEHGQAILVLLCLESHLLASSSENKPFLRDSVRSPACFLLHARAGLSYATRLGVHPAYFLGQGQAFQAQLCLESLMLASSRKEGPSHVRHYL